MSSKSCFIKTTGGGKCKFCHKELMSCGNTTNVMNHLIRKHGFKRSVPVEILKPAVVNLWSYTKDKLNVVGSCTLDCIVKSTKSRIDFLWSIQIRRQFWAYLLALN